MEINLLGKKVKQYIRRIKMPIHRTKSGGYKWGKSGKTYYGKGAKRKVTRQGRAIKASGYRKKK